MRESVVLAGHADAILATGAERVLLRCLKRADLIVLSVVLFPDIHVNMRRYT